MKNVLTIAMLLGAPVAMAQEVVADPAAVSPVVEAEAVINELCSAMTEMADVLESVKDQDTADIAAEKLMVLIPRMRELQSQVKLVTKCDAENQQRLGEKLVYTMFAVKPRVNKVGKYLVENEFFGSEALKNAVRSML